MGRTQFYTATSIDGFIADDRNSLDWLFSVEGSDEQAEQFPAFFAGVGAMAMGSTTYEWVVAHERLVDHPQKWREWYDDIPTWVFTHRDLPVVAGADIRFTRGDVAPVHAEMVRAAAGRNVWVMGGGDLAGQFADAGLLDEMLLAVAPVTLGAGAPLLPRRLAGGDLQLTNVRQDGQFALLTYEVARRPAG